MCFSCFPRLRPRYKRLVDDIFLFPAGPEDGSVKNNMEKLTYYALLTPEKLDRIGEYLYQNACREITRKRESYVKIAMEAMDQLLVACHAQTLNLFVESFLHMVQKLLECPEPELQIIATQSFIKFANIEDDTPYHRRYDFFISKFSSMCHNNNSDPSVRDGIRLAGIKGLQGVIRKTVSDNLVRNIWVPVHLNKIIPSLLYNMQNPRYESEDDSYLKDSTDPNELLNCNKSEDEDPAILAESCFRELVGRASFGHVKRVIRPVLRHFDLHGLWVSKSFALHCFRLIMFSIQTQYLYIIIECLMVHLDEKSKLMSKVRANVADVLSNIIAIAAGESIGPTVLEIVNSLLTQLRRSVILQSVNNLSVGIDEVERNYQESLLSALGEFAAHLPDYQKIEIMMFIMSKIVHTKPVINFSNVDNRVQHICLKSLLMVCSKYSSIHMAATLPRSFFDLLRRCSRASDRQIGDLVKDVLHTLFDRQELGKNMPLIYGNSCVENPPVSPCSDVSFLEFNSNSSSPCVQKKYPNEDLTFEAMKRVLTESTDKQREQEALRSVQLFEQYKYLPFEELVRMSTRPEEGTLPYKLSEIFSRINTENNMKTLSRNESTGTSITE